MIPRDFISEWRAQAPWRLDAQVEQDLVISRALVEMFSVPAVRDRVAFRGGTALYKLHFLPPARYSEDIDLVQVDPTVIGDTLDHLRSALDPWLGQPQRKFGKDRVSLVYRFESEDSPPMRMRLKVEINTQERFTELGLVSVPFAVEGRWFSGSTHVTTFDVHELLGTKLRALYQRRKGRDLFDMAFALQRTEIDIPTLIRCFQRYMTEGGHAVSRAQFEANLLEKSRDADFRTDTRALLGPTIPWDFDEAMRLVRERVVAHLPGDPWRGDGS